MSSDKGLRAIFVLSATILELLWFLCHSTDYEGFDKNVILLFIAYNITIVVFYFVF